MIAFPNAKINIGLNVIRKRSDGFHDIESIFYPVHHLYDVLEIHENKKTKDVQLKTTGIKIPGNLNENLCVKAFLLLKNDFDIPWITIHLHKVIPIGAGLGGGSADAAFTLKLLNDLFGLKLTDEELIDYSRQLGSDCSFFIKSQPVYAIEKGDVFEEINLDLNDYKIKIAYPNIHINTAMAYEKVIPKRSDFELMKMIKGPLSNWKNKLKNDFEDAISTMYPAITELKQKMYNDGAVYSSMTGSGSAVYGIFKGQKSESLKV